MTSTTDTPALAAGPAAPPITTPSPTSPPSADDRTNPAKSAFWRKDSLQQDKRDEYEAAGGGGTGDEVHAAHILSCEEMVALYGDCPLDECLEVRDAYWGLGTKNYRMAERYTNQAVHRKIDNMLIDNLKMGAAIAPFTYDTSDGETVSVKTKEIIGRIQQKIDQAKEMGDMVMMRLQVCTQLSPAGYAFHSSLRQSPCTHLVR